MIITVLISIILFFLVLGLFSATSYRQRNYYNIQNKLFLIRNPNALTEKLLLDINNYLIHKKVILSFESIKRGADRALVCFAPSGFDTVYVELQLMEIEDYTVFNAPISCYGFLVSATNNFFDSNRQILKSIEVPSESLVAHQLVFSNEAKSPDSLYISERLIASSAKADFLTNLHLNLKQIFGNDSVTEMDPALGLTEFRKRRVGVMNNSAKLLNANQCLKLLLT